MESSGSEFSQLARALPSKSKSVCGKSIVQLYFIHSESSACLKAVLPSSLATALSICWLAKKTLMRGGNQAMGAPSGLKAFKAAKRMVAAWAWLSLVTVALVAVLPRVPAHGGNTPLPGKIGGVSPACFHTIAFFILAVLAIFFVAAHAQQIRAQMLAQEVIESLINQDPSDAVHPRELFDMLRTPSLSRVAPLAQLLRGK